MPTPEYWAGFFDGEGSVLIYRRTKTVPKGITIPYQIRATVTNTNHEVIRLLHSEFGGCVMEYQPVLNARRAWKWTVQCRVAAAFLRVVLPHLVIKGDEARLALEMQDRISLSRARKHPGFYGQPRLSDEEIAARDAIYFRLIAMRKPRDADRASG